MRLIGHLPEESAARTFSDFLLVQGIDNQLEDQKKDGWAIWVSEEDKLEEATNLLKDFSQNTANPKYQTQGKAAQLRAQQEQDTAAYQKRMVTGRQLFRPLGGYGLGPVTLVLIGASIAVTILTKFGSNDAAYPLLISERMGAALPEIRHGQIWRLFTPIFIHLGMLHIVFNMLWLRDLGSMIEGRKSSWLLAVMVLVIGAGSNLGQVFLTHNPGFGGMSGVVYGLFGYIWIRGKCDPGSGLFLHQSTVTMMIIWFFVCFSGFVGDVANGAHGVGLIMGMAWGYLSSLKHR